MRGLLAVSIFLLMFSNIAHSQTSCTEFNRPDKARIYYVNGMLSDLSSNHDARVRLQAVVGNTSENTYRNSVNQTKNFMADGFQAWRQRAGEVDSERFWEQWHGTNPNGQQNTPEFEEALADAIVAAANAQVQSDPDLANMVSQYLFDLRAGKKVVMVAHSQGNFYANRAKEYIDGNFPEFAQSIGVVSVASPSSALAPGALLTQNALDSVIFGTVSSRYSVLPSNVSFTGNDDLNHGFLTTYMLPANAQNRIANHVTTKVNQLTAPIIEECDERVATVETLSATDVKSTSATLRGQLTNGQNVDAWIIVDRNPSNVVCDGSNEDGNGVFSAPSALSIDETGLEPYRLHYFRACAKGQVGGVSDGGLKQFITERNSGQVSAPQPVVITRDLIRVQTEVLEGSNIDVWFVRGQANNSQSPSCSAFSNQHNGTGQNSEGDTVVSGDFNGLSEGAAYRFRACAKGSDLVTNQSPVNTITTTSAPTVSCSNQAFQGSTEGLAVRYTLSSQPGFARVTFSTFTIPDRLQIFKHNTNQLLLSTNGFVSGTYQASFPAGGIDKVDVFVTGNSDTNTQWELTIECPAPL